MRETLGLSLGVDSQYHKKKKDEKKALWESKRQLKSFSTSFLLTLHSTYQNKISIKDKQNVFKLLEKDYKFWNCVEQKGLHSCRWILAPPPFTSTGALLLKEAKTILEKVF